MKLTLPFSDPLSTKIEHSGGKGANLALLTRQGFPVPPGFIIAAQAYHAFMPEGVELLERVEKFPFDDPAQMEIESARLRDTLARSNLPASAVAEVRMRLGEFPPGQCFSVRSSSTMEDLASAAFAGQHETFLNCMGEEQILEKVKACFLSLWSARAIAYRHQQQFDHRLAAMAVVVQQMVPCDVAGVGFSINPVTGDIGEMILDANFGLGESVVGGQAPVDHFVIDKSTGAVRTARIAEKTCKIVGVTGGTEEVPLAAEESSQPCLTIGQIGQIADLLLRVEQSYRFPQDIEWGFAGGKLFLLQSRPVTTIPPRWTRDESAERFPNAITPLTWDFVEGGFHRSLRHSFRLMGFPPCHGKWFEMHGHYIYGNQNIVDLYGRRAPFVVRTVDELRTAIPQLREEFRWVQELPIQWSRDLDFYLTRLGELMAEPLEEKNICEVWQYVRRVHDHGTDYFMPNIAISITHATLYRVLERLLAMTIGPEAAAPLCEQLLAFCETKTGTINKELFELACIVRNHPPLEILMQQNSSKELIEQRSLEKFPQFHQRFEKFLRDHGHRELDFDAYQPTWGEVPWVVLDNLRLVLQSPLHKTPAEKERALKVRMQQAELELFSKLPADLHFFFSELLRLARLYTGLDDLEHYETTRLTVGLRRGLRELGQRLAARSILDQPMDIFFAREAQIEEAVRAENEAIWKGFAQAIRQQKEAYLRDQARKPEWVLGEKRNEDTGEFLAGLAGSPGQAEGPVFIVLTPEDFGKFPKGAVLVARTTNPSWTPLFYSAVAVITESGGPLSHGAVTAREMRIPAVMSVRDTCTRLKNGQFVRVDGTHGKVYFSPAGPPGHANPDDEALPGESGSNIAASAFSQVVKLSTLGLTSVSKSR